MRHPKVRGRRIADIDFNAKQGELSHFYVYPEARKKGYGIKLLRQLEREARQAKAKKMIVWVSKGTERFYEKHGYKIKEIKGRQFPRAIKKL